MKLFPPRTPWVLYIGGVLGFIIIFVMAFVFPRIGGAYTIALMVLGQGIAAVLITTSIGSITRASAARCL